MSTTTNQSGLITPYSIASKFIGLREKSGMAANSAQIVAMLQLDGGASLTNDEIPWCSAFVNYVAWLAGCERSKSLAARSWLRVGLGEEIPFGATLSMNAAKVGNDIIILQRGAGKQPGPTVLNAQGHVGFYHGHNNTEVYILGGNQSDSVSIARYPISKVLGVKRLRIKGSGV